MFTPAAGIIIADRYALIEEIGRGGMGSVWKAQHRGLRAALAIKFMLGSGGRDAAARRRFVNEARAAAGVQSPYVARVFDVDEWDGVPYIAMEFLEGETLGATIERGGALSPELTCAIIDQVALGLARAHAVRLVHRDLKPSNVFLVRRELGEPLLVKVLDFGLAKQLDLVSGPRETQSGMLLGTPGYMSPEQALHPKLVDERADLWSLAAIAYHCLTGKEPFPGEALAGILLEIVQGRLPIPSQVNARLGAAFDTWWQRAAHRDPGARPGSAAQLAKELRAALRLDAPSMSNEELRPFALRATEISGSPAPAVGGAAAGGIAAVTIPSHAVTSLPAESEQAATATPAAIASAVAAAIPAAVATSVSAFVDTSAPAKSRHDSVQPAVELQPRRRDGLSLYALVAVSFTALGAVGFSYWSGHREVPVDGGPTPPSVASPPARVEPPAEPEAGPGPAAPEGRAPKAKTAPADPSRAAKPADAPASPAAPTEKKLAHDAERESANGASEASGSGPSEGRPERPLASAKGRPRHSPAPTRPQSTGPGLEAAPPVPENKIDWGF